jgi:hypothetical protein
MLVVGLAWTCFVADLVHDFAGPHRWWIPGDVWVPVPPAAFIVDGAFAYQYEPQPAYVYPPGLSLLYAPVVAVSRWLALSDSAGPVVQRPTMWLALAPIGIACAFQPLVEFRRVLWEVGNRASLDGMQLAIAVVAIAPIALTWGHFEELVVLGTVLTACRAVERGRVTLTIVALAAALLFKQTTMLVLPTIILRLPRRVRLRAAGWIAAPTVAVSGLCLVLDWEHVRSIKLQFNSHRDIYGSTSIWSSHSWFLISSLFWLNTQYSLKYLSS